MKGGSKKLLLIIRGEGFRVGSFGSRQNGAKESYKAQKDACNTHMDLVRKIESKGYTVEILLNTYHTNYDKTLRHVYEKNLRKANFHKKKFDSQYQMVKNSIESYESLNTQYDVILMMRLDMHLKQHLIDDYDPSVNTVQFLHLFWTKNRLKTPSGEYRINEAFIHFPHRFFDKLKAITEVPNAEETFRYEFHDYLQYIPLKYGTEYSLLLDQFHEANPEENWNPCYTFVGRKEADTWYNKGKKVSNLPEFKDPVK